MTIIPSAALTDPMSVTEHPDWCSPAHCLPGVDVQHSAVPTVWTAAEDDVELRIALVRDDEHTLAGEYIESRHGVRLGLENTACVRPGGGLIAADVDLTPDDAERLAAVLIEHAALARAAAAEDGAQ